MIRLPILLAVAALALPAAAGAADAAPPRPTPPKPPAVAARPAPAPAASPNAPDQATVRRANQAAEAYERELAQGQLQPSAASLERMAEVDLLLAEADAFLDQGFAIKGGDCFVAAGKAYAAIPAEERRALGPRATAAQQALTALSRRLLESAQLDPEAPR